jgi:hypothetical protein
MTSLDLIARREISRWLTRLAGMTRQSADNPVDAVLLSDYAEVLISRVPCAAFTSESLGMVASASAWFPPVADIVQMVGDWWQARHRIAGPADAGNSARRTEQMWMDYFDRRMREFSGDTEFVISPEDFQLPRKEQYRRHLLRFIRSRSPDAYARLAGDGVRASA